MIVFLLLASWHPCSSMVDLGKLASSQPKQAACDAADLDIALACHCKGPSPAEKWGATKALTLTMPKTATAKSGEWIDVPFTLTSRTARVLDLVGGSVVVVKEARQKGKLVESPPCSTMALVPDTVRVSMPAGGKVRGVMKWRAANYQGEGCADGTKPLAPGSYVVTFESADGEPRLRSSVTVTVR